MRKKGSYLKALFLAGIISSLVMCSGCFEVKQVSVEEFVSSEVQLDHPSILPEWHDSEYHAYYETTDLLNEFQIKYPDLVNLFSIGKSVLGKTIWCIRITNEQNSQAKHSCLIDGSMHGCEWEGGEACLYLAEYLLINFDRNKTVTALLNASEIFIIPLVNPDGREVDDRFNANGVDLNRNFDVDFGRIRGGCLPVGTLRGQRKFTYRTFPRLHKWIPSFPLYLLNCGRQAFSEPESQAVRDFMYKLDTGAFSFYVNCHTAVHSFSGPWTAFRPPFELSNQEKNVYGSVFEWVEENTEYEIIDINFQGESYRASGTVMDWCFKEFKIPSFTFEILSQDYEPGVGGGKHDSLVHWMKTTLPVFMYLLVNIENLQTWETPDIQPSLPEGVPPLPLK